VLAELVYEYFDMAGEDPFMMFVAPVLPRRRDSIAAVCHIDHTCRIQTVGIDHPGRFRALLESYKALTGVPLVLNTSFNIRGEPMVETPGDALDCFLASNLDVLYLEGRRITRASVATAARPGDLVPVLNNGLSLGTVVSSSDGRAVPPEHHVQTRTGYRAAITADDLAFLRAVDGKSTVREIGDTLKDVVSADPLSAFASLQSRGFVSFRFAFRGTVTGPG
jgi:carbamoyltransferase